MYDWIFDMLEVWKINQSACKYQPAVIKHPSNKEITVVINRNLEYLKCSNVTLKGSYCKLSPQSQTF